MKKFISFLFALFCLTACSQVNLSEQVSSRDAKKWQKDLVKLHEELKMRHVDLYHNISEDSLDESFNRLHKELPELNTSQILIRISQIVASIGDGHTSFYPGNHKKKWFGFFPMKFWSFSDGIYVISTTEEYKDYLGQKIVAIENTPISDVFTKVSSTIGADNDMEYIYSVPFLVPRPELLNALGIISSDEQAEFHFEKGSVTLHSIGLKQWQNENYICGNSIFPDGKSPSQRPEFLFATSLTLDSLKFKKKLRYYWYKRLEDKNAMFFQYNVCWDQIDRPRFASMIENMFKEIDETDTGRLIIDLRNNTGGEPLIAEPLLEELKKRHHLLDQGRVFVIVGRRTFSAALTNAVQLRKIGVRTVGEMPRGKPNNPSEGRDIELRSTKIWVTVSTEFVERDPALGDQDYLPIDIKCELTITDYQKSRDLALEKALAANLFN